MNCENAKSQMLDLLSGELPADAAAVVRAHVDACEACTRDRAQLAAATRLARQLPSEAPSPSVRLAVLARARAVAAETRKTRKPDSRGSSAGSQGSYSDRRWPWRWSCC
jgi:anti-sigma factor RsiW